MQQYWVSLMINQTPSGRVLGIAVFCIGLLGTCKRYKCLSRWPLFLQQLWEEYTGITLAEIIGKLEPHQLYSLVASVSSSLSQLEPSRFVKL